MAEIEGDSKMMFPLIFNMVLLDALSSAFTFTLLAPAVAFQEALLITALQQGAK